MAASSGRSNPCNTCRKRRVKCDEGKPTCRRCEKSKYSCGGYDRPLHFRIAVASDTQISNIASTACIPSERSGLIFQERYIPSVPRSLNLTAFKSDMCFTFLIENFVWRSYGYGWIDRAATLGRISPLSYQAVSALSQSNFGIFHGLDDLKVAGSETYGVAVQSLIEKLSNPTVPGTEELIVPIMLLLIHDSISSNPMNSISHVRGLVQLLMMCGPEKFQQEPFRSAFESCRATLITVGLISKKRCILDDGRWRTVPWALDDSKSHQNLLADILVMVPGILEDDAVLCERDDPILRIDLINRVQRELENLFSWRWKWHKIIPLAVWEKRSESVSQTDDVPESCPTQPLHFSTFERSTEIMLYNTIQIWLTGILWRLVPTDAACIIRLAAEQTRIGAELHADVRSDPLLLPGMPISFRELALEICRIFQYQCHNVHASKASALFYMLPIGLAWSVLDSDLDCKKWITSMLNMSPVTKGYVLGQNVFGFGFYLSSYKLQDAVAKMEAMTI